ncbi:MAG: hypothetical protein AAGF53_07260 [Pseudomonadota bacterium]
MKKTSKSLSAFLLGACVAGPSAGQQQGSPTEIAFLQMSQICGDPTGAPDAWRDKAESVGWTPVRPDQFEELADYRTQARLVGLYLAGHPGTFPTPITFQVTKEVFVEELKTEQAQIETFARQSAVLRPRFYKFDDDVNFTVSFSYNEVTPGSGVPQSKQECIINYVGPNLTNIDEQSRLASPDISTTHGIYELDAFGGNNPANGVVTVSRTKPIDAEKAKDRFGTDLPIYFYSVVYQRNSN